MKFGRVAKRVENSLTSRCPSALLLIALPRARWLTVSRHQSAGDGLPPRAGASVESAKLASMLVRSFVALGTGLLLAQCSSTLEITAENISPISYQSYTCPDLAHAALDLSAKASELSPATGEKWSTVKNFFGFRRSENPEATRLAELKGQLKAIEQVRTEKKC
jgi:hypothetical protein